MVPSQALRTLPYGSWEQSTVSLWLLFSLKENHLGSPSIQTVSSIVSDQRWEVTRGNRYPQVTQGAAAELMLILGLLTFTLGLYTTHPASSFAPSLKAALNSRVSFSTLSFTRSLYLSVFSWHHSKLGRLTYFLTCQHVSEFIWEEVERSVMVFSWNMSPAMKIMVEMHCVIGSLGVGPSWRNLAAVIVETLGQSTCHLFTFWTGVGSVLGEVGDLTSPWDIYLYTTTASLIGKI